MLLPLLLLLVALLQQIVWKIKISHLKNKSNNGFYVYTVKSA